MSFILVHHDSFDLSLNQSEPRTGLTCLLCAHTVCVCLCVYDWLFPCVCEQSVAVFCINTAALILTHTNTPRSHLPLSALAVIICQRWQPPLFNRRRSACHSSRRVPNHPRAGNLRLCWRWLISSVLSTPPSWLSHPANIRDWLLLSCYRGRSGEIDMCSPDKGSPDVEERGVPGTGAAAAALPFKTCMMTRMKCWWWIISCITGAVNGSKWRLCASLCILADCSCEHVEFSVREKKKK